MGRNHTFKLSRKAPDSYTWRERFAALRCAPLIFKLAWEAHPGYVITVVVLKLIRSLVPISILWVGKLIIDAIVVLHTSGGDSRLIWKYVGLEIVIVIFRDVLDRSSDLLENLLASLFNNHASLRLMAHAATLDLHHFEDPTFYDQLERARQQTGTQLVFLAQLLSVVQETLTLISLGTALFVYSPWLLLILTVTLLPSFLGETHFTTLEYLLSYCWTAERRHLDYLRYIGASKAAAKEVQLFGLSPWLIARFHAISQRFYDERKRLLIRKARFMSGFLGIGTLGYYAAYTIILSRAINGSITLGTLTFLVGSFARARDLIHRQLMSTSVVFSQALFLKDLFDFFQIKPSITSTPGAPAVPRRIREGFVFEDVGFRYPGSEAWAVRHLSFRLLPGERVAFVGENGAGKTTICRLLSRLHDPAEGRILLDGRDIREYDLCSLRQAIGIIFQDFFRYDWQFDENIGVGNIEEVKSYLDSLEQPRPVNGKKRSHNGKVEEGKTDHPPVPLSIVSAAEKSLASTLLSRFPEGYRQMLGRRFEGSIDLSGGEWQTIALARAYIRDAQVLILDEPTASLDARAEYEIFKSFSRLVDGRMAVVISHRFSTVRMADRIIVLRKGLVIEEGSHEDLVAGGGLYAKLFSLQAEGYR